MVWQANCWLEQLLKHDWLAVELLVVVAAPDGAVPGTTQAVWQLAACELQLNMQLVVVDVCASRIDVPAFASEAPAMHDMIANPARVLLRLRTCASFAESEGAA